MKKARFFKYVLIISSIAILLISISAVLVFHYYPKEKILNLITSGAEKILKRKVIIRGIDYGLQGITLKDISIYNNLYPDGVVPESDLLASVANANIRFSLLPLLKREFIINRIVLNNFKIIICYDKGKSNLGHLLQDLKGNGNPKIETKISSIRFKNAEITLKDSPEKLNPLEGRYIFNGTINISSNNLLSISGCEIVMPEQRGIIQSDDIDLSIKENDFEISGDCQLHNCSLLWVYKWDKELSLPYVNFTGSIERLRITKESVEGYVEGNSLLTNANILNVDGQCKVDITGETVYLLKVQGEIQKSRFFINEIKFSYKDNIKENLLRFNVSDIDIDISDLKAILNFLPSDILSNIYGGVSGSLAFENKIYNGALTLKDLSYRSNGKEIFRANSEIQINNNIIYKEKIPVFIYSQPCRISISVSGTNFQKIILNLYAKEFNYMIDNKETKDKDFSKIKFQSEITGRFEIDNLNVNKYAFSNATINYSFNNGRLNLNQLYGNFMGGSIKGNGYIDVSGENPYIDISAGFEEIKVQNIAGLKNELSGRFFGTAKGNASVEFGINKDSSIFDSLKGKIEFNIDKGKLVNTGIQKGLGIWLSELKYKLNNIEFSKIYGNLNIIGNNCYVNSMLFNAPDVRLKIDGYFSKPPPDDKRIPGDIKIILEFNDYFISDIPNLPQAQFLKVPGLAMEKKGDWYIKPFRDKGDDITDSRNIKPL